MQFLVIIHAVGIEASTKYPVMNYVCNFLVLSSCGIIQQQAWHFSVHLGGVYFGLSSVGGWTASVGRCPRTLLAGYLSLRRTSPPPPRPGPWSRPRPTTR